MIGICTIPTLLKLAGTRVFVRRIVSYSVAMGLCLVLKEVSLFRQALFAPGFAVPTFPALLQYKISAW